MCVGTMAENNNRYSACIRQHFQLLVRSIDPSPSLLAELSFIDCLTEEIGRVESMSTNEAKNVLLLQTLRSKPGDVVDQFIDLLKRYEHSHVASVLLGNDDSRPMSEQFLELLRVKKNELCCHLNPSVDLLTFLESRKVLTSCDAGRIKSKQSTRDKSDELLTILERKPDRAFDTFVEGLNRTGQSHVACILTGEGDAPIEKNNIRLLDRNRSEIAENLEPVDSNFIDELLSQGALTEEEYQRVKDERNRYEQAIYLVDMFKHKSNRAFDCFIATLRNTGQSHLASQIAGVNATVDLNGPVTDGVEAEMLSDMEETQPNLLSPLHEDGIHSRAEEGSIKIRFSCTSAGSLTKLRELCESGEINTLLYESHGRKFSERGLQSVTVRIPPSEFEHAESCTLMTKHHRRLLKSAADKFAVRLTVSEQLLSRLSLCSRRRQAILSQPSREERSRLLFDIVSRQADSAFQRFVTALRCAGNTEVAEFLHSDSVQSCSPGTSSTLTRTDGPTTRPSFDGTLAELRRRCDELRRKLEDKTNVMFKYKLETQGSLKSPRREHGEDAKSCTLMTPRHRRLLRSAADNVALQLNVSEQLLSRLSLCSRRRQAILSRPPGEERSRILLDIVSRQADSAFQQLVDALRATGNTEVAEFLDNDPSQSRSRSSVQWSLDNLKKKTRTTKYGRPYILQFRKYILSASDSFATYGAIRMCFELIDFFIVNENSSGLPQYLF